MASVVDNNEKVKYFLIISLFSQNPLYRGSTGIINLSIFVMSTLKKFFIGEI